MGDVQAMPVALGSLKVEWVMQHIVLAVTNNH